MITTDQPTRRKRPLSVFMLVMINVIAIDSLRNLSTNAAFGLGVPFYYLLATLFFMLPCAWIIAELATHHPKTGGAYVWVERAFGPPWGFVTIWLQWIYNVFWYPTILSFIAANIAYLFNPELANSVSFMLPMTLGLFLISTVSNSFGMRLSGEVSTVCAIVGSILPMLFITVLGIMWIAYGKPLAITPTLHHFFPALGETGHAAFLVVILFSLFGLEMSAVHAGDVEHPTRNYPRALLYSSLLIILTLTLASTAIAMVVPHNTLNIITGLDQALSQFLDAFGLRFLLPIALIAMVFGGFGNMSAWVIGPPRGMAVAAQEGYAPASWGKLSKTGIPITLLWIQAGLVIVISSLFLLLPSLSTAYWVLSNLTAELALLFYVFLFAAAWRLRYHNPAPVPAHAYRIPGGNGVIGFVCCLGLSACLFGIAISFMPPDNIPLPSTTWYESLLVGGMILFSLPPFLYYTWRKRKKMRALR